MWSTTIKSLLSQRVRLALTATAVVLGVAFVTGTLVLTDTMTATFDGLAGDAYAGVDVAVLGAERTDPTLGQLARADVPVDLLAVVRGVDGVATAEGSVQGPAFLTTTDGTLIGDSQAPAAGVGSQAPMTEALYAPGCGRAPTPRRPARSPSTSPPPPQKGLSWVTPSA